MEDATDEIRESLRIRTSYLIKWAFIRLITIDTTSLRSARIPDR